ncbi:MAG: hypothetical protein ABI480_04335 [Chitinophagaceae bacterium]
MNEEYERNKRKQVTTMRSLMDYGIGVLMLAGGVYFLVHGKPEISFNDKILGSLFLIYGAWRIYRGYKKNYFR